MKITSSKTFYNNTGGTFTNKGRFTNTSTGSIGGAGQIENDTNATLENQGIFEIRNNVTNNGTLINGANAQITLASTGTCHLINNKQLTNKGAITMDGGTFTNSGNGNLENHNIITVKNGTFSNEHEMVNYGTIQLISGTFTNENKITNNNTIEIVNGTFTNESELINNKSITNSGKLINNNNGTLSNNTGATIINTGIMTSNDQIKNAGSINSENGTYSGPINGTITTSYGTSYIDENGDKQTLSSNVTLSSVLSTYAQVKVANGWYIADKEPVYQNLIELGQDITLCILDGKEINFTRDTYLIGDKDSGSRLTICAQSTTENMGQLKLYAYLNAVKLVINSGNVYISNECSGLNINGGVVTIGYSGPKVVTSGRQVLFTWSHPNEESTMKGVIFIGNEGKLYGDDAKITPTSSFTIPEEKTLIIENGKTLTIPAGRTLINNGKIDVKAGGTLKIEGKLFNNGVIIKEGNVTGNITGNKVTRTLKVTVASVSYGKEYQPAYTLADGCSAPAVAGKVTEYYYEKGSTTRLYDKPSDAGEYTVEVSYTGTDGEFYQGSVDFTISKAVVTPPEIAHKVYTGERLTADVDTDNKPYTIEENTGGINSGSYDVVLKLNDTKNYRWDSNNQYTTVKFLIKKAQNEWSSAFNKNYSWTYGEAHVTPTATAKFGTVKVEYKLKDAADNTYKETAPASAGTYTVRFSVEDTANYNGLTETKEMTIEKRRLAWDSSGLSISDKTYDGTDTASVKGSLKLENVAEGDDASNIVSYDPLTAVFDTKEVGSNKKVTVTISNLKLKNNNYILPAGTLTLTGNILKETGNIWEGTNTVPTDVTYDGKSHTATPAKAKFGTVKVEYKLKDAEDNTCTETAPASAGTYTVRFSVEDTANYNGLTETKEMTIEKRRLAWDSSGLSISDKTYDGTDTASVKGSLKLENVAEGDGASNIVSYDSLTAVFDKAEAGNGKNVIVTINSPQVKDKNYILPEETELTLTGNILKAKDNVWEGTNTIPDDAVYDGKSHAATSAKAKFGTVKVEYKLKGAEDNTYTETAPASAGTYTVRFSVEDTANYNGLTETKEMTIEKRRLAWDSSGLSISDKTYDGTDTASVKGSLKLENVAEGDDASNIVSYDPLTAAFDTKEVGSNKKVTVTISNLKLKNGNYILPAETLTLTGNIFSRPSPSQPGKPLPDNVPDGSRWNGTDIVTPNGTTIKSDGSIVLADGTKLDKDSEGNKPSIDKNGTVTDTNGTRIDKDGTVTLPGTNSQSKADDTKIEKGTGSKYPSYDPEKKTVITETGNIVIRPDGTKITPPAGSVVRQDGTITYPDGTITAPDGTVTYPDGTIIEPDGTVNNTDGSIQTSDGTYLSPAVPLLKDVEIHLTGNQIRVSLVDDAAGAQGYDFVISQDINCIKNKNYLAVNKNVRRAETDFRYLRQGTYYIYCHAWLRDKNNKKIFGKWSEYKTITVTATMPETPKIKSIKVKGNTVTVTYTICEDAEGYDIVLGKDAKNVNGEKRPVNYGVNVKKVKKQNIVTVTFKNIKKGTYYIGLHAWNRSSEDKRKVFSPWSDTKQINKK